MAVASAGKRNNRRTIGPYSRLFRKGVIGDSIDGRSTIGRLARDMERQLIEHIGGKPSVTEKLLIERMVRVRLQLDLLDEKMASGNWTGMDSRTYGALLNAYRLLAREIGIRAAADKPQSPDQILAEIHSRFGKRTDTEGQS